MMETMVIQGRVEVAGTDVVEGGEKVEGDEEGKITNGKDDVSEEAATDKAEDGDVVEEEEAGANEATVDV